MSFLKGLGEAYNVVKTQILLTEPLPGINKVFSLVLQQERHLSESIGMDTKILANSTDQQHQKSVTMDKAGTTTAEEGEKDMENSVPFVTK